MLGFWLNLAQTLSDFAHNPVSTRQVLSIFYK